MKNMLIECGRQSPKEIPCQKNQRLTKISAKKSTSVPTDDLMFRLYNALFSFFKIQWTNAPPAGAGSAVPQAPFAPPGSGGRAPHSLGRSLRGNVIPRFGFSCFGGLNGSKPTKTLCVLNFAKVLHKFFFKVAAAKILKRCFCSVSSAPAASSYS